MSGHQTAEVSQVPPILLWIVVGVTIVAAVEMAVLLVVCGGLHPHREEENGS